MTTLQSIQSANNWQYRVNENFASLSVAALYGVDPATTTGLTLGYLGGNFNGFTPANGTLSLTASATNYVVAARSSGVVSTATDTTNWTNTGNYLQLYIVVTGASTITTIGDYRQAFGVTASGGGGMGNPMTTTGDLIYSSPGSTPARLAIGINGYVLSVVAGVPAWTAAGSGGFANPMTTAGDLIVGGTSGAAARLAASTAAYVLTSNGPGVAPTWQAVAGGGAGLVNWTESSFSAIPNSTVPVVRFTPNNAALNVDAVIGPKGQGSLIAQVPDNQGTGGNKRGAQSVDWQMSRSDPTHVASNSASVIGGGSDNMANGGSSTVSGGTNNTASGSGSNVAGGTGNTATGANASAAGGSGNTASGATSFASGISCIASGASSVALGDTCTASGDRSFAMGGSATTRGVNGAVARAGGRQNNLGDRQTREFFLRLQNNSATPKAMTTDGLASSATNTCNLGWGTQFFFVVEGIIGSTTDSVGFTGRGVITRASGGDVALNAPMSITMVSASTGATSWTVAANANTSTQCLEIVVTGPAASYSGFATLRVQELVN